MRRDMDIPLLRAFVTVVDAGSVTSAGRLLGRTQAAVSLQIKRLEDQLGVELFVREHRKLTLTATGERLLASAEQLLALNDDVLRTVTTPAYEGDIRIGVPHDIILPYMPAVLRSFDKAWPKVQVLLESSSTVELRSKIANGDVDVILTTERGRADGGETLLRDRLVWVGGPNGEAHNADPLPLTMGCERCNFRPSVLETLRNSGRDWRIVCQNSHMEPQLAVVEADLGVMPLLLSAVPPQLCVVESARLPRLPDFYVNMYVSSAGGDVANELALHTRTELAARFPHLRVSEAASEPAGIRRPSRRAANRPAAA